MIKKQLVIVGSGPAGYTAALYAARAQLAPLVFEGSQAGGQLMLTTEVENYPGFPDSILGPDLMEAMRKQTQRFGAQFQTSNITQIDLSKRPFTLTSDENETIKAQAVIMATGASAKWLGVPNEANLAGRGVSTCATCDGFFFRDLEVAVVGGGDSAIEEALFLTRFATHVYVIHRRDSLRASKIMVARAEANDKISFTWNTTVTEMVGDDKLQGLRTKNLVTGQETLLPVQGCFVAIGHTPNTEVLKGQVDVDHHGYVVTHNSVRSSVRGLWACGDVQDRIWRQAVTAAGSGCMAAMDAERYLEHEDYTLNRREPLEGLDW